MAGRFAGAVRHFCFPYALLGLKVGRFCAFRDIKTVDVS
jgi:hypothetical protein